jgi:hypothetical protein
MEPNNIPQTTFQHILFCSDLSENADFAFSFALDAAQRRSGCQLYLLHVIPESEAQFWKTYVYEVEDVDNKARHDLDERIRQAYLSRVPEGVSLKVEYRVGKDWQEILDFAETNSGRPDRHGPSGPRHNTKGRLRQCYRENRPKGQLRRPRRPSQLPAATGTPRSILTPTFFGMKVTAAPLRLGHYWPDPSLSAPL